MGQSLCGTWIKRSKSGAGSTRNALVAARQRLFVCKQPWFPRHNACGSANSLFRAETSTVCIANTRCTAPTRVVRGQIAVGVSLQGPFAGATPVVARTQGPSPVQTRPWPSFQPGWRWSLPAHQPRRSTTADAWRFSVPGHPRATGSLMVRRLPGYPLVPGSASSSRKAVATRTDRARTCLESPTTFSLPRAATALSSTRRCGSISNSPASPVPSTTSWPSSPRSG